MKLCEYEKAISDCEWALKVIPELSSEKDL